MCGHLSGGLESEMHVVVSDFNLSFGGWGLGLGLGLGFHVYLHAFTFVLHVHTRICMWQCMFRYVCMYLRVVIQKV